MMTVVSSGWRVMYMRCCWWLHGDEIRGGGAMSFFFIVQGEEEKERLMRVKRTLGDTGLSESEKPR